MPMTRRSIATAAVAVVAAFAALAFLGPDALRADDPPPATPTPPTPDPPPATPSPAQTDGADGLKALFTAVLTAAQGGDEAAVRKHLEAMKMTEADFKALFAEDRAAELLKLYSESFDTVFLAEAPADICRKVKERGYDEVEAYDVAGDVSKQRPDDKKTIAALKEPAAARMFSVRLKKKGQQAGLRYDSFFFREGRWVTGLRLAMLLPG